MGGKWWESIKEHLALIISGTVLVLLAFKLLFVANGNVTTARALVSRADLVQTGVGVLLQFAGVFSVVGLIFILSLASRLSVLKNRIGIQFFGFGLAFFLGIFLVPWLILIFIAVASASYWFLYWGPGPGPRDPASLESLGWDWVIPVLTSVAVVVCAIAISALATPWVAAQEFRMANHSTVVGYELNEDGPYTYLLTDKDRKVIAVRSSTIRSRKLCNVDDGRGLTDTAFFALSNRNSAKYPKCKGHSVKQHH